MDNFRAVYKILSSLERAMDYPKFDLLEQVSPEHLKVSEGRYKRSSDHKEHHRRNAD